MDNTIYICEYKNLYQTNYTPIPVYGYESQC